MTAATRSLYDEALDSFRQDAREHYSGKDRDLELLEEFLRERASPEETKKAAQLLQADAGKKWGARKAGNVEIPESWIANIMGNIEYFLEAGDFLTKNAPESVGMAWYAIRLTLTAIHTNYDLYTFFGTGLSDISEIMIIVRHYDRLYDERSKPAWKPSPIVEKLFQDVIGAYAAVLDFSFAVKRHLTPGSLTRIKHGFKDFFGLSKQKFEDKLNAVAEFKKKIIEGSQGAFQDRTLTQLEGVSTILVGIEDSVRHIQDFQETQQKLHAEAMAKFDTMLKGLDDIKASTKRKSRWDYAIQEFKAFQADLSPLEGPIKVLSDTIDAIHPGTCQWIFNEVLYQDWRDTDSNSLLCITGAEGSGKSYLVASIANAITQEAHSDKALLYVTCHGSTTGAGPNTCTADSICRTLLSQLYELAVQGEENVGLLESCNVVFSKAKEAYKEAATNRASILAHMRDDNGGLPEFAEAFSKIATLLKKNLVLVLDGLDKNNLDDKDQSELLRKFQALMAAAAEPAGVRLRVLVGCASSSKFLNDLDLFPIPYSYIDVADYNWDDMDLVLTDALKNTPGLSSAEQAEAKTAILEKARSRFLYVLNTAIPFMREPFQRPLSNRLNALPDGTNDTYSKALRKMSPNYLDLLRTALTWSVLSPEYPGDPYAREVMDAFQGIYDMPPEEGLIDGDVTEAGFPKTSRLEMDQLREATDPFLKDTYDIDGDPWLYQPDPQAITDFFVKSESDAHEEHEDVALLCAKCGAARSQHNSLSIDPKTGHLQMALTCLRHLNHPLFQRRAGLIPKVTEELEVKGTEKEEHKEGVHENGKGQSEGANPDQAVEGDCHDENKGDSDNDTGSTAPDAGVTDVNDAVAQLQAGYMSEESVDDEDTAGPDLQEQGRLFSDDPAKEDDEIKRIRYEILYWPWHIREAEQLWPAEERATNRDWQVLMKELDKFAFDTPQIFNAWQIKFPDKGNDEIFGIAHAPHKPLHVAAYLGLSSWTKHLLDRGEELEGLSEGFSALQAAACGGDRLDVMKLLLDAGADINADNGVGRSAFFLWLLHAEVHVDGVRTLLKYHADPSKVCSAQHLNSVHYFATKGQDPAVLDLLVANGADINLVHPEATLQLPPLHILLGYRRDVPGPMLEAFIKHGADTNSENFYSARPLQFVCISGHVTNLRILLQSGVFDIDDEDLDGTTAVHEATFYNHSKCVRLILEHGANADILDKHGRAALHTAARKGYVECVRALLEHTKQPNLLDKHGWSPFFCATLSKDQECASLILDTLIEQKVSLADVNKPTRSGRTPLRQAADHGFDRVVSALIRLAQDTHDAGSLAINAQDTKKGMSALHRAALGGHVACVRALLSADPPADPSLRDKQARTALTLAYDHWAVATKNPDYKEIVTLLIDADPAGAAADPELVAVCAANGCVPLLEKLWRLGADLLQADRYGWTPRELSKNFGHADAEAFIKLHATTWAPDMLPSKWAKNFPSTTPIGAQSVCDGGKAILHTTGKRVCISADKPLPAGLERYYFELTLKELPSGLALPHPDSQNKQTQPPEFPEMAIGFCTLGGAALEFPGWAPTPDSMNDARSWGYHSDTGNMYFSWDTEFWETDAPDFTVEEDRYKVGDTVGAGVDLARGEVWFTRNGSKLKAERLERLERLIKEGGLGVGGRLVPVVGVHEGVWFEVNFGGEEGKEFVWKGEEVVKQREETEREKGDGTVVRVVVHGEGEGKGEVVKKEVEVTSREVVVDVAA